jgi:hypothetical protein
MKKASEIFGDCKIDDLPKNGTDYLINDLDINEKSIEKANSKNNRCDMCGDSGGVKTGEFEYSTCPCVSDYKRD